MKKTLALLALAIGVQMQSPGSAAGVIDFDALYRDDDQVQDVVSPYLEDGFQLVNTGLYPFATYGARISDFTGSTALINDNHDGVTTLSRVDGDHFKLVSIDLAELAAGDNGVLVAFTGTRQDLGTVSESFLLDGLPGAQTFEFSYRFTYLTSVSWVNDDYMHQFDNIAVAPVPATYALTLVGLGLVGGLARRRRERV